MKESEMLELCKQAHEIAKQDSEVEFNDIRLILIQLGMSPQERMEHGIRKSGNGFDQEEP